ncbi:hypothetical protein OIU84_015232 [Salix udensis]|uniref:Pentatricopeptide repeat-containing protein n=1 Tax=Salix udensis TaxID=889485 RepID=A0AAD6JFR6_9ROSI|nr:hypothetical protein OIU84_015232 [Salix udensis]
MASSSSSQFRVLKLHSHSLTSLSQILRRFSSSIKGSTAAGGFNFDDEKERRLQSQNPPDPLPNRPLRGDRPNFNSDRSSSNRGGGGGGGGGGSSFNSNQSSSNRGGRGPNFNNSTNRPPRPQSSHPPSTTSPFNPQPQTHEFNHISDDAFLDKFKLRPDNDNNINKDAAAAADDTNAAAAPKNEQGSSASTSEPSQDAEQIFNKMKETGLIPNAGLSKCNLLDDAIDFCFEMLELGHSPNVTTFVGLIDGLCREKGVEEARTVIGTLRQKGFHVHDKAVRDFLDKNKPLSSSVWDAIFGKKPSQKPF